MSHASGEHDRWADWCGESEFVRAADHELERRLHQKSAGAQIQYREREIERTQLSVESAHHLEARTAPAVDFCSAPLFAAGILSAHVNRIGVCGTRVQGSLTMNLIDGVSA